MQLYLAFHSSNSSSLFDLCIKLKVFNLGREVKDEIWFSVYRQLIAGGVLKMKMDGSSKLELTEKALPIIKGEQEFFIRPVTKTTSKIITPKAPKKTKTKRKPRQKISAGDEGLYEALKSFRRELARARKTKPYRIFPDKTLQELADIRPTSLSEMEDIYGVGPKKLKRFGKIFIDAIEELA